MTRLTDADRNRIADRQALLDFRLYVRPADKSWWADIAQDGEHLAGPFETEDEATAALESTGACHVH